MSNIENTQIIDHINEGEQYNVAEVLKKVYGALLFSH